MLHSVFLVNKKDFAGQDEEPAEVTDLNVVLGPPEGTLGLLHHSDSFRTAADVLQRQINLADNPESLGELLVLTIVLRGFAAECILKAILDFSSGKYDRTHDLSSLYAALHPTMQDLIEGMAKQRGKPNPKTVLASHKGDFVRWRYPGGLEGAEINLADLDSIIELLRLVSAEMAKASSLQTDIELRYPGLKKCPNCAEQGIDSQIEWGGHMVDLNEYRLLGPALVCPRCGSRKIPVAGSDFGDVG